MRVIKKGTSPVCAVLVIDAADHITGLVGLTPASDFAIYTSENCAAFGSDVYGAASASTIAVATIGYGWYKLTIGSDFTDTTGDLTIHIVATGGDPVDFKLVVAEETLDDLKTILDKLPTNYIAGASSVANLNNISAADVNAQCDTAVADGLAAYGAATAGDVTTSQGVVTSAISGLNDLDSTAAQAACAAALEAYDAAKPSDVIVYTSEDATP